MYDKRINFITAAKLENRLHKKKQKVQLITKKLSFVFDLPQ